MWRISMRITAGLVLALAIAGSALAANPSGTGGRAGDDVQVMDYRCPPQIKQVLPLAQIASAVTLPLADVGQAMFHRNSLAQLGSSVRRQLPLAHLLQQTLVGMNTDAPASL